MARKIVITSGKGGVGKTTITANLGFALAKMTLRVALVDLDIGLNNLDVSVTAEDRVVFDIFDVASGRCRIKQAMIQDSSFPSLYFLPCTVRTGGVITSDDVCRVLAKMNDLFDYILIDCPAGIDAGFRRAVAGADEAFVICTPHLSSIRDADKVITILSTYRLLDVSVIVNRLVPSLVLTGKMLDPFEVFALLGSAKPIGIIGEDERLNYSASSTGTTEAFEILAENIHTGTRIMADFLTDARKNRPKTA